MELLKKQMKIAVVHDYLNQYGGAERVLEVIHEMFPTAPIFTTIYLPENLPESFRKMDIRVSFMQKLPLLQKHFKKYLLLYPLAMRLFDLSDYDMILSSSSAFAKGVKAGRGAFHICYCYTPMRFAWRYDDYIKQEQVSGMIKNILPFFIRYLKKWDLRANKGVNCFIATCRNIKERIRDIYGRESEIIYPPVTTHTFSISDKIDDYFLLVSRLVAYKRIDIVVKAFNGLGLPLRIIGDGPYRRCLESFANSNVKFLGKVSEKELVANYSRCQATISPGEEDFGLVPLESLASGRPVIAYARGGSLETVIEGVTGVFFHEQTPEAVFEAIARFGRMQHIFESRKIREYAQIFEKEIFKRKLSELVTNKYYEHIAAKSRSTALERFFENYATVFSGIRNKRRFANFL